MSASPPDPSVASTDRLGFWGFATLLAAVFALAVELSHYGALVGWHEDASGIALRPLAAILLFAKSLLPALALLLTAWLLDALGRRGLARLILILGSALVIAWFLLDFEVQRRLGANLAAFLPFVWSALRNVGVADHLQWAGDPVALAATALPMLLGGAAGSALAWAGCRTAARRLVARWPALSGARPLGACVAVWGVAILAAPMALGAFAPPQLRFVLASNVPAPAGWLVPDPTGAAEQRIGLRIAAVVPNVWERADAGRVLLYNAGSTKVDLAGWTLTNATGRSEALLGEAEPDVLRAVELSRESFDLSPEADRIVLRDRSGETVDAVEYAGEDVKRGAALWFPSQQVARGVLDAITRDARARYLVLRDRIVAAHEISLTAPARAALPNDPPHVVVLVVESLRADALSQDGMPRLARWSASGLRGGRHYAGSNSSHRGLFGLLFARSSFVYDAVLDTGQRPVATKAFASLGYETALVTSSPIGKWQRLDEFLNADAFDRVIVHRGGPWTAWPDRDRRTLEEIRRLLAPGAPARFVVGLLMTTHFPYAYPDAFARHRPALALEDKTTWPEVSTADLAAEPLRNRYRNSVLAIDDAIGTFLEGIDPGRAIVVVVGDHGESFGEDGTLVHGSRASEVQLRTPFVMVGPGVPSRQLTVATSHPDVLPTLLHAVTGVATPLRGAGGRDLLAGPTRDAVLINPYTLSEPAELLLVRDEDRLLLHARTDRAEIEAFGFLALDGSPLFALDGSRIGEVRRWQLELGLQLERLAGVTTAR